MRFNLRLLPPLWLSTSVGVASLLFAFGCGGPSAPPRAKATPASTASTTPERDRLRRDEEPAELVAEGSPPDAGENLDPADDPESAEPEPPPQRLVVLLPGGPLLVDFRLTIDGRPFAEGINTLVEHVLSAGDTNGDGIPTWDELAANSQFLYGPLVRGAGPNATRDWKGTYDLDKNGWIAGSEAKSWLGRDAGRSVRPLALESSREFYYQPRRHSRVWALLNVDGDGMLSDAEIAAASARLLTRDADDNRVLYLHDLENLRDQLRAADGNMAMTRPRTADRRAAFLLSGEEDWQLVSARLMDLYAAGRSLTADAFPGRADLFVDLDSDGSGHLATTELADLAGQTADMCLDVEFGTAEPSAGPTYRIALSNSPAEVVKVLAATGPRLALRVAGQHLVFSVHDLAPAISFDEAAADRLASLDEDDSGYLDEEEIITEEAEGPAAAERFIALDANGDGMVVEGEIADYLRLENAVARGQTEIVVHDQGDALFERLDADHDGRLGEREIAAAAPALASLDADSDGRLTVGEIAGQMTVMFIRGAQSRNRDLAEFAALASPVTSRSDDAPHWFRRGDWNADGVISPREFLGTPEQFAQLDADRDGWISAREASDR